MLIRYFFEVDNYKERKDNLVVTNIPKCYSSSLSESLEHVLLF